MRAVHPTGADAPPAVPPEFGAMVAMRDAFILAAGRVVYGVKGGRRWTSARETSYDTGVIFDGLRVAACGKSEADC